MPAIEVQAINTPATDLGSTSLTKIPLLPGAIEGVETNYYMQVSGARCSPTRDSGRSQNFLFTAGAGEIQAGGIIFAFSEIAAFFTGGQEPIVIQATSDLEYLEVMIDLQDQEVQQLQARIPFFVRYSECEAYAETIKSAKTVSRTIVPAKTIPGFCMGSVESSGPDEVAAHSHPILEQLFFGLPGNSCMVTADGANAALEERVLLHIPLGSWHGVRVRAGSRLHYVWMDFFKQEEALAYIQEQHKPVPGPKIIEASSA